MSALAPAPAKERAAPSLFDALGEAGEPEGAPTGGGAGPTLDQEVASLWRAVVEGRPVTCPWCGGGMRLQYGAHARAVAACCGGCGSTLS